MKNYDGIFFDFFGLIDSHFLDSVFYSLCFI